MQSTLFIPKKLKIGFQERSDTFTGKLAYVIYFDEKGKLRKESSWESWRDKKIEPIELENKPQSGFVLNKGLQRCNYYHWGSGRSVIRVHHPDGFEFEISVDNLIGILMHSDVSKRDIVEECVFAWAGTELVLLPVNSDAYRESVAYTEKQDQKLSAKSLVQGRQYAQKKSDGILTYIGYHEWFDMQSKHEQVDRPGNMRNMWHRSYDYQNTQTQVSKGKKHVFFDGSRFVVPSVSTLSAEVAPDVVPNYAELVDQFFSTIHSQPIVGVKVVPLSGESRVVSRYNSAHIYRHDEAGGFYDNMYLPSDCLHYVQHGQLDQVKRHFKLQGTRYHVGLVDGAYTRTHTSYSSSVEQVLPFDTKSNDPAAFNIGDIAIEKAEGYHTEARLSERLMSSLRDQGYGDLYFILKNGNLCKGE